MLMSDIERSERADPLQEMQNEIERLRAERDALLALLCRVLSCGLNEEPHGVGFTYSRQKRIASELYTDIFAAIDSARKNKG